MKKVLIFFLIYLIVIFFLTGIIANQDYDYREIIQEQDRIKDVSNVLSENLTEEKLINSQLSKDDEKIKEQLRELGYLD